MSQLSRRPGGLPTIGRPVFRIVAAIITATLAMVLAPLAANAVDDDADFELRWESEFAERLVGSDGVLTSVTADISIGRTDAGAADLIAVDIVSPTSSWAIGLVGDGQPLTERTYAGAVGALNTDGVAVFTLNVDGEECAESVATFEVLDLAVIGETVQRLAIDFQLGCGGGAEPGSPPQLFGSLRYNSTVEFDDARTITGTVTYADGRAADEALACANAVSSSLHTTCVRADDQGRYEIADLDSDDYYISFTAPEGAFECFDAQAGCESATYLAMREPIFVNSWIDATLADGCAGLVPTITGTTGDDTLSGTNGRDVIVGLGGNDTIDGFGGDDVICGGTGNDIVLAGDGADSVNAGDGNDKVWGQGGNDTLAGGLGDDRLRGGSDDDFVSGGVGDDDINAGRGNDRAFGGDGDDTVRGGTGDDVVSGGDGSDYVNGNGGYDQVFGDAGDDEFVGGGPRADVIDGGDGNDVIKGLGGPDQITGGAGNDTIFGGKQNDVIDGSTGIDDCNGGSGDEDRQTNCESVFGFE